MSSNDYATTINAIIVALDYIEKTLGIDPQGTYPDIRIRLDVLEKRIKNPLFPSPSANNPFIVGTTGVTISAGTGEPTENRLDGSLYLRQDGDESKVLYIRKGGQWYNIGIYGAQGWQGNQGSIGSTGSTGSTGSAGNDGVGGNPTVTLTAAEDFAGTVNTGQGVVVNTDGYALKATSLNLSTYGGNIVGIVTSVIGTYPNQSVVVQTMGVMSPTQTNLGSGTVAKVRLNSTTGCCERVSSFSVGDAPVGACNTSGWVTLVLGLVVGNAPTGEAGGGLLGYYPNPQINTNFLNNQIVTQGERLRIGNFGLGILSQAGTSEWTDLFLGDGDYAFQTPELQINDVVEADIDFVAIAIGNGSLVRCIGYETNMSGVPIEYTIRQINEDLINQLHIRFRHTMLSNGGYTCYLQGQESGSQILYINYNFCANYKVYRNVS